LRKGVIKELATTVKSGKESKVLAGKGRDGDIAIKVYCIAAANFRRMIPYLLGDPRFARVRKDRRSVVFAWCKKEFKNLLRATAAGVSCPAPRAFLNNVLVMDFIGQRLSPAPRLVDIKIGNAERIFEVVVRNMAILYQHAGLVHGDLSEYNILLWRERPWLIDFSQAAPLAHPAADSFLKRDIRNLCKYFSGLGVKADEQAVYNRIVGKVI
ncbi:MAG: serine protein kinase RIO, partial [Candidatus Omnitrophota bacterium]|nr:serine protein kinase RIO [Candidatus Omnitrophota bacterium]